MSRAGRYELVRPLARGGMAEVFLARRRAGGVEKLLVVKRIRAERANDPRFQELFKREAKLSMSLAHQNIVPVFDFGRIGDRFFLAMERVEGKDLGSSLAKRELPPPLVAAFIAAECCQALDYAHSRKNPDGTSRNIVHRDVTPRNVLLSWSGEVKLTDFGIASLAGEEANKHGTPAYMAPEQARGEAVDARSDVYALGMVLREALTGERARPGESQESMLAAARAGTLAPWPAREVSSVLTAIVDRATAAKPDDRFSVHDFAAELDGYIVGERAAKRGDSPAKQLAAWLGRAWGDEARVDSIEPIAEGQPQFLSFLDEDGIDAIGTGTQRSMAATAADEEDSPKTGDAPQFSRADKADNETGERPQFSRADKADKAGNEIGERPQFSRADKADNETGERPQFSRADKADKAGHEIGERPQFREGQEKRGSSEIGERPQFWRRPAIVVAVVAGAGVVAWFATRDRGLKVTPDATMVAITDASAATSDSAVMTDAPDVSIAERDASIPDVDAAIVEARDAALQSDAAVVVTGLDAGVVARTDAGVAVRPDAGVAGRSDAGVTLVVPDAGITRSDAGVATGFDAGVATRPDAGGFTRPDAGVPRTDAGVAVRPDAPVTDAGVPAIVLRKVHINATPWAYFTVDGGPRMQTPKLLELAPGPHRIHFENSVLKVERDITLDVPADRDISYVEPLK